MNELLMSIKTKYANQIFNGTKKYEFRTKSIGEKNLNRKVYIYSSEKDKAIIGYLIFDKIISGSSDFISNLDIKNKKILMEYFNDRKECYAFEVKKYVKFINLISLKEIKQILPKETMPQFYKYLDKNSELYKLIKNNMEIHFISKYLNDNIFNGIYTLMYEMTKNLANWYNNYSNWFFINQKNGVIDGSREIIFVINNNKIISYISIKKAENKISTIYVAEKYRNMGIGTKLFEEAMLYLDNRKPFMSINKDNLHYFNNFINKYEWEITNISNNEYYLNNK